jgi:cytosine/adenosine deaminase-related metal-dependent hydrolase
MNPPKRVFRSRLAWTGERVVENPVVVEHNGRIVSIGAASQASPLPGAEEVDFGDAVLFPGFINAHCHLEYSCLKGRLPAKTPFAQWLAQVGGLRHTVAEKEFTEGVRAGISECVRSGTTTVLDIFTKDTAAVPLKASGLRAWGFLESISLDPEAAESALDELKERLESFHETDRLKAGLSPHTPYTVSMPLGRKIAELARERGALAAIHLAETPEERQMMESGGGPLADVFRKAGFLPENWKAPRAPSVSWADRAGLLGPRTLAVHVNDVSNEEIAILASSGSSVAFCPKCHEYFGRQPHPLPRLIEAGVNVCIGTDSLASNDALDLLAELREARRQFPEISPLALFQTIGANPARFLGEEGRLGVLNVGAHCDLTVLSPAPKINDAAESMLAALLEHDAANAVATIVGGKKVECGRKPEG